LRFGIFLLGPLALTKRLEMMTFFSRAEHPLLPLSTPPPPFNYNLLMDGTFESGISTFFLFALRPLYPVTISPLFQIVPHRPFLLSVNLAFFLETFFLCLSLPF